MTRPPPSRWLVGAAIALAALGASGVARAQSKEDGPGDLGRGHAAWLRGDFDVAETLFASAIEHGHLQRREVLDAFLSLGAAHLVRRNTDGAMAAFRLAAMIDPDVQMPEESGRKAAQMLDSAKKQVHKAGAMRVLSDAPSNVVPNVAFEVRAHVDPSHVPYLAKIRLRSESGGQSFEFEQPAAVSVLFKLPKELAVKEGVKLHLTALDAHANELVSSDMVVEPSAGPTVARPAEAATAATHPTKPAVAPKASGGFWSSPWPYVIGGIVVAGAGTAGYFLFLAPPSTVSITQVKVQALQ